MAEDFREQYILKKGDMLVCGEHTYTIEGAPLGYGGSAILYPAKRSDSELNFAIKEYFPCQEGGFIREGGVVKPMLDGVEMDIFQERIKEERILGQEIRNHSNRAIFVWEELSVDTITVGGKTYSGSEGVFALLERMDGKGCMLSDVLEECRKPEDDRHPLCRGGLPHIHTTARIMIELLSALQEVHESGYLHGDIQPGNLFFASSRLDEGELGYGCFYDFGCSRKLLEDGQTAVISDKKVFSTEGYIPPEIRTQNDGTLRLSKAADIYSAGRLMLLQLLTENKDLEKNCFSRKRMLLGKDGERIGCSEETLGLVNEILCKALSIHPKERYQDAGEMLVDMRRLEKRTAPPKYRLPKNMSVLEYFLEGSRDAVIANAKESLSQNSNQPVMLWGYGGLGKTETAIKIAEELKNEKGAYLVPFRESMQETVLGMAFSGYKYTPGRLNMSDEERQEEEYRERLRILQEEYEGALFIIDNFDHSEKTLDELRREKAYKDILGLNMRWIFTTRYPVNKPEWEIKELAREDLLKIMKNLLSSTSVEEDMLYALIDAVGGHTLMVVLIAKTLEESWGEVTPEGILEALKASKLSEADFPEVVSDQNRTYRQAQIYAHMSVLFRVAGLTDAEKSVLTYATLLPQTGMDAGMFKSCVEKEKQEVLKRLAGKGWLRRTAENLLTIHPVIREVAREELKPSDEACEVFLKALESSYEATEFDYKKLYQRAECFAQAADYLEDERGQWNNEAGFFYNSVGEYKEALRYAERALEIIGRATCEEHLDLARCLDNMGAVCWGIGHYGNALKYIKKAIEIKEKIFSANHPELAVSYNQIGVVHWSLGNYNTALEYMKKAIEIRESVLPSNHPDIAESYINIGRIFSDLGKYESALEYERKSLEIREIILSSNHPNLAAIYDEIGAVFSCLGRFEESLSYKKKALKILECSLPSNHMSLIGCYCNIGNTFLQLKKFKEALMYQKKALEGAVESLPSEHPNLATIYDNIGITFSYIRRHEDALNFKKRALEIREKNLSGDHPDLATSYYNVGVTYFKLGDNTEALKYGKKALEIKEQILPIEHPDLIASYANMGAMLAKERKYQKSLEYIKKVLQIYESCLQKNINTNMQELYNSALSVVAFIIKKLELMKSYPSLVGIEQINKYLKLSSNYYKIGNLHGAIEYLDKALELLEE